MLFLEQITGDFKKGLRYYKEWPFDRSRGLSAHCPGQDNKGTDLD